MLQSVLVEVQPSRFGLVLILALNTLALGLLMCLDAALFPRTVLGMLLVPVAVWQLRKLGWLGGRLPVVALSCGASGCKLRPGGAPTHAWQETMLEADYLVVSGLIALNFRVEGSRRAVPLLLFPDSADQDAIRRLRALLRARKVPCRRGFGAKTGEQTSRFTSLSLRN